MRASRLLRRLALTIPLTLGEEEAVVVLPTRIVPNPHRVLPEQSQSASRRKAARDEDAGRPNQNHFLRPPTTGRSPMTTDE